MIPRVMPAAIAATGLTKDFGADHGIFDLDLEVHAGEAFGFIGPNGAGKTTTLRLLMDLLRPTRGSATVLGLDTQTQGVAVRRRCGFLPGEAPDYPNQTGAQILDLLAHLRGGVAAERITELAGLFEIDLHRKYREYSHGNKQKVWLIQTFMHDPELVFLDEPTTGLDPLMQQVFRELVQAAKRRGATVFLSSHVLQEVQEICDRIAVIHAGRLRRVGTIDELRLGQLHRLDVRLERAPDPLEIERLPGVSGVTLDGLRLRCSITGAMAPLLDALRPAGIVALDSAEMSLEEVFLAEYGQPAHD